MVIVKRPSLRIMVKPKFQSLESFKQQLIPRFEELNDKPPTD